MCKKYKTPLCGVEDIFSEIKIGYFSHCVEHDGAAG